MMLAATAFIVPKRGCPPDECDDAFCSVPDKGRFAVADGATESSFSDRWAQSLVRKFSEETPFAALQNPSALRAWFSPLQQMWHSGIHWDTLPWYAEEKARSGAFASLLGLEVGANPAPPRGWIGRLLGGFATRKSRCEQWRAMAIGDSNLFQVREGRLICAFPVERSADFGSRPLLVASNPEMNRQVWNDVRSTGGTARPGDLFFLATDALACWFLKECESASKPWTVIESIRTSQEFAHLADQLRQSGRLHNDDTTLICIRCLEQPA